jgi:hypothetical protein
LDDNKFGGSSSIWQMRKSTFREIKWFTGGHTAGTVQGPISNYEDQFANHRASVKWLQSSEVTSIYHQRVPRDSKCNYSRDPWKLFIQV